MSRFINQPGTGFKNSRQIYMDGSGLKSGAEKPVGQKEQQEQWRDVDAMAKFSEDIRKTLNELAAAAFPNSPEQQKTYADQIEQSLLNHLSKEKTLEDLWGYLKNEGCSIAAILQGFLNFYKMVEGKREKIDINEFFATPAKYPAELGLDKEYSEKRETLLTQLAPETRSNLKNFLEELKSSLPDLPQYPS